MSYKSAKLSPPSTQTSKFKFAIRGPWSMPPAGVQDVQFLRSWLEYDSGIAREGSSGRINWSAVCGLFVIALVSASFWAGVGLAVARALK
jgi:hypothetical protein